MTAAALAQLTIPAPSQAVADAARARQGVLTKPPGSLGQLEELAIALASYQHSESPSARPCSALLFAADHPVTVHGISPFPSAVTQAMVANFKAGGAAAAVLCRSAEIPLHVIDAGVFGGPVDAEFPGGDLRISDAMSPLAFDGLCALGMRAAEQHAAGNRLTIFGEMGIGNTTAAAAVAAALLRLKDPADIVGAGTGATGSLLETKRQVVRDAVARLAHDATPLDILRCVGGREMVAMYAAMKSVLSQGSAVLVDGFIVSAVAAVLVAECPAARSGLYFAHQSAEQGHRLLLAHMHAQPLLSLDMRLGEASGALMAFPIVERACALHNEMATFDSAGIPGAAP